MKYLFSNFYNLIKQFKSSAGINILGLSAALVVFFIVTMQAHYDLTYDKGYSTSSELLQFNIWDLDEQAASTHINFQTPERINQVLPEAKAYCMATHWGQDVFDVDYQSDTPVSFTENYVRATAGFWDVFASELIMGDTTGVFSTYNVAMLSESTAKRMFGDENPIGKTFKFHYGDAVFTVGAVCRDFPDNCSMPNGVFENLREADESEWSFKSYFLIDPQNWDGIVEKINTIEILGEGTWQYLQDHPEENVRYRLTPPNELYLHDKGTAGRKIFSTTMTMLAIGVLTLLIAFVNFVNLSLAMAPSRVRGVNIRKILGINKTKLRMTIAMESVFFTLISIAIAFVGVYVLKGTALAEQMFTSKFTLSNYSGLLTLVCLGILLISLMIGLYTSKYTTAFDESEALKGSFALGAKGVRLRNVLIVLQFTTAISLICISGFIRTQHDYMINYDSGLPKENIIYVPLHQLIGRSAEAFGEEILRDPRVADYCVVRGLPGAVQMSWGRVYNGANISLRVWSVDNRFFDFFNIQLIAGEKPTGMDSLRSQMILNETFLKKYGYDEQIVGKDFPAFGSPAYVRAVAKDVNFDPLHQPITPMAYAVLAEWHNFRYVLIKLTGNDTPGALAYIEQVWDKFSSDIFQPRYLDESLDRLYAREGNQSKLIGVLGVVIVIIAVMGVYGLIIFNTRHRRKEIGIRKVNGASIGEIVLMLNRSLFILLGVAFVIAVPVAWYAIVGWRDSFAYRADIPWWLFPAAGILILIISAIAVSWQSLRAASANPADVIKSE